jgi:serine/threonine protein kinase
MHNLEAKMVDKYKVISEIGRGGMGTVYKALDSSRNRYVALKVLSPFLQANPEFLKRFQREADAAARLRHPNIIKVYETGQIGGHSFIAMEYMDGGSLHNRLQKGRPLDQNTVINIVSQIASALDYAHSHGVIHRDLKPSNILFARDGRAVLSDFGIAKTIDSSWFTEPGTILGTPYYMSPEQAKGLSEVDHRSDIYSLGALCYEMLTGSVPFERTTSHAVLHAHIYEAPRPLRQINPRIPRSVEEVILRALEKDPRARYQTASELATNLRASFLAPQARVRQVGKPNLAQVALVTGGFLLIVSVVYFVANVRKEGSPTPTLERPTTLVVTTATTPTQVTVRPGSYQLVDKRYVQTGSYGGVTYQGIISIDRVEVTPHDMTFYLSEVFSYSGEGFIFGKRSDMGNKLIYLTDNLGHRYDQTAAGGDFARDMRMEDGLTAYGWFRFPSPKPGACIFIFRMDDQHVVIDDIVLTF